jgi:hypothetical protein
MVKLSQQAIIVAVAAILPILVSAYKRRIIDSIALSIVGVITIYNVDCLTRGNCNTWATLVSMSFFITTVIQFIAPYESYTEREQTDKGWLTGIFPTLDEEGNVWGVKENLDQRLSAIEQDSIIARKRADYALSRLFTDSKNLGDLQSFALNDYKFSISSFGRGGGGGGGGQSDDEFNNYDDTREPKIMAVRVCKEI